MVLVYDKHIEEMKPLHEHLTANKMNFEQFLEQLICKRYVTRRSKQIY